MSLDVTKFDAANNAVADSRISARTSGRASSLSKGPYRRGLKRAFDLLFALLILPVVGTVIAVLYILVRMEGAPAFFAHERVGARGKRFPCYKLRTMRVNADAILKEMCDADPVVAEEWHKFQKLENDPRITKLGRFLRATSLDELPQIWNVIRGDMSFVGPRPYTPDQELLYEDAGGWAYTYLRPGITGLWQIEGRNATTFTDRARYDNLYGRTCNFRRDLGLIVRTVTVVFNRTGK